MMGTPMDRFWDKMHRMGWFGLGFLALSLYRFYDLDLVIDGPHIWRQCDTAQYIYDFYKNGIDLAHPSVCWMGGHKTIILEFPLPEAMVAILYDWFGESLLVARLFFIASFLLASGYFYRIVKMVAGLGVAQLSTLIFMVMPMGIFYSRAIHLDFFAVMLAHGMLYYYMRAAKTDRLFPLLVGTGFAVLAFLVKAPYAFYLAIPFIWFAILHRGWGYIFRYAWLFSVPVFALYFWTKHRHAVNAAAPDWDFIPHYRKFVNMWGWYFGDHWQRSDWANYSLMMNRVLYEVTTPVGMILGGLGLILPKRGSGKAFWVLWLLGAIAYMLIFFNLNRIHNYYQIPFMAPFAVLIALGIRQIAQFFENFSVVFGKLVLLGLLGLLGYKCVDYAHTHYFSKQTVYPEAGYYLQSAIPENDLIIATHGGMDPRAPHILYRTRKLGWSIPINDLQPELVEKLTELGAKWSVVIAHEGALVGPLQFLGTPVQTWSLTGTEENLYLFSLE